MSTDQVLVELLDHDQVRARELNAWIAYGANKARCLVKQGLVECADHGAYRLTARGRDAAMAVRRRI